jgi:hypothetical protein
LRCDVQQRCRDDLAAQADPRGDLFTKPFLMVTEAVTQNFLGVQLQCARCHDHPFEAWTQLGFYGTAAFFARLQVVDTGKKDNRTMHVICEKNLGDVLFTGSVSEQAVGIKGELVQPKFLHDDALVEPELPADFEEDRNFPRGKMPPQPRFSRKDQLAGRITRPDNPDIARAVANRRRAQYMGRGIIHPVDNMRQANTTRHARPLSACRLGSSRDEARITACPAEVRDSSAIDRAWVQVSLAGHSGQTRVFDSLRDAETRRAQVGSRYSD